MLQLKQTDKAIAEQLAAELAEVGSRLSAELLSELPCVNSLVGLLERYRGKMLRPMLVLVSGMASSPTGSKVTDPHRVVATVVEIVHLATLVHDDVLDEAQVRRHRLTINHLRGNEAAVMLGDYLISHAYHLCSSLGNPAVSRVIAEATNTVCEGELLQLVSRDNWSLDERTYFQIIRRKTASLCGTCCRLGAALSGASEEDVDNLYEYGEKLGVAFQIVDDVLDLLGAQDTVGKTLGRDLEKGKLTLPLIHFLATASPCGRRRMVELLTALSCGPSRQGAEPATTADQLEGVTAVRELLKASSSVDYANLWARRLVDQAKLCAETLPPSNARALLLDLAEAVLVREL
jgi:octaprenyl-diphosphate synthase